MNNEFGFDSLLKYMADSHRPELPSPGLIWWRAQILKKQQEKQRIERPLMIMRGMAGGACVVAFLVFLAGSWSQLELPWGGASLWGPLVVAVLAALLGLAFLVARPLVRKTSGGS
jgi:hypothetical protein